jgi:hypothetical protein
MPPVTMAAFQRICPTIPIVPISGSGFPFWLRRDKAIFSCARASTRLQTVIEGQYAKNFRHRALL